MARAGLIDDFEKWIYFIEARNKKYHTYDEDIAKSVLSVAKEFLPEGDKLLHKLTLV